MSHPPATPFRKTKRLLLALMIVAQAACSLLPRSGGYYQDDGPPRSRVDLAKIPDAVPKREPMSPHGNRPYTVFNKTYYPVASARDYRERGVASWYGKKFHGRRTSNGERYDMYAMTAAHRTLPLPTYARVRNLANGRSVIVRVNDRGPFLHNRLIDLSYAAAAKLGILATGTGLVEVETIDFDAPREAMREAPQHASSQNVPQVPQAPKTVSAAGPPALKTPQMFVQAGAFASRENADLMRQRLERVNLAPVQIVAESRAPATLYRVRLGPLLTVEESDRILTALAAEGFNEAIIAIE